MNGAVLIIGAGGIGCGAAFALAAAGVRALTVVDDDVVDRSNLQRQILHAEAAVGRPKVDSLAETLEGRFPGVRVRRIRGRFDAETAPTLVSEHDIVLDGSDNLATKFLANDAAVLGGKPLVHGAAVGTFGQLLSVPAGGQPCYRCLFEDLPPPEADAPSCSEAGVLGPVPGVIGALQAAECVRFLAGDGFSCAGRLIRYDSPFPSFRAVRFRRNPGCAVCGTSPTIHAILRDTYMLEECSS